MKIAIIGYGFVGMALANALTDDVDLRCIDPKLNTSLDDLKEFQPDCIFICLPTPMHDDGSQDASVIENTLNELRKLKMKGLIVLKSTVHPGNLDKLHSICDKFVYNPEFLREKHADQDFINSQLIVFGGDEKYTELLAEIYSNYTKCICKNYAHTDVIAASLIKYTINSFLATKVIFFNEINALLRSTDSIESWENFVSFLSRDERIGSSHMMVPGHDGRYGFGGACLPKDALAIAKFAETKDTDLKMIKNAIKINNKIRSSYNSRTKREDEQNIKYKNLSKE